MPTTVPRDTPVEYLERQVLPLLLAGLEETLRVAKKTEVSFYEHTNYKYTIIMIL